MTRTRRDRRSFGSQRSKTRRTRLLSILQVTSVNRLVPVQANSVILLISASFFPPPPSSKRDRSASLDIPTPYPIYPVLEFRRSFRYARPATKTGRNAPQRRQEPDERGWDVTLPKLVTGQQRGHCIKYWLDRASSCRFFAIDPNPEIRFTIALRLSSPRFQNWSGVFTFSGTRVNMSFSVTGNDHPG